MTYTEVKQTKAPPRYSARLLASGFYGVTFNWEGEPWDKWVYLLDVPQALLGEWDHLEHAESWARALCKSRPIPPTETATD